MSIEKTENRPPPNFRERVVLPDCCGTCEHFCSSLQRLRRLARAMLQVQNAAVFQLRKPM